jgi:hypothetical protein
MQVWVNIYDPTYSEIVANRLRPIRASYKRKLDEAGMGRATFALQPRALAEIRVRRVVEVWLSDVKLEWDGSNYNKVPYARKLGAFVIEAISPDAVARTITVRGPGFLSKLIDKITLPGLAYENQSVASVLSNLASLAGWTVNSEAALSSQNISVRFAGENVLRAVRFIVEAQGLHMRESSTAKQFDAGVFGDVNSHALFVKGDSAEMAFRRDAPMMIQSANITEESSDVVNKVFAYGGGDGDAALTMELATGSRGFVDSETANSRTHWFIADSASIALYGEIGRRLDIKRINPTDATDAALTFASVAVADAAKAWLDRHSVPYERLDLRVQNVNDVIYPGDKVHVTYQDVINLYGVPYQERNIDEPYYVMSVEELVSDQGLETSLEVANIDRYEESAAEIIVGMVDSIEVQNINIQPYPAPYYFPAGIAPIDTNIAYASSFIVNTQTVRLNSAKAFIFRSSWTAVAGVAQDGGDHRHLMFNHVGSSGGGPISSDWQYYHATNVDDTVLRTVYIPNVGGGAINLYTFGGSGDHNHDTEFSEVQVDDGGNLLEDVTLKIDGATVSTGLFPNGNTDDYAEVDITDPLKSGTLRGVHTIEVECGAGRGDIYCVLFIDVDVSRVRVS